MIRGYVATVDHEQMGLPLTAFVSITPIDPSEPDDYPDRLRGVKRDRVVLVGRRRRVLHPQGPRRHPRRPRRPARPHPLRRQRQLPHHHRPLHAVREPPGVVGLWSRDTRSSRVSCDVRGRCNAREGSGTMPKLAVTPAVDAGTRRICRIRRASSRAGQVVPGDPDADPAGERADLLLASLLSEQEVLETSRPRDASSGTSACRRTPAEDPVLRPGEVHTAHELARARRRSRPAARDAGCARARTGGRRRDSATDSIRRSASRMTSSVVSDLRPRSSDGGLLARVRPCRPRRRWSRLLATMSDGSTSAIVQVSATERAAPVTRTPLTMTTSSSARRPR